MNVKAGGGGGGDWQGTVVLVREHRSVHSLQNSIDVIGAIAFLPRPEKNPAGVAAYNVPGARMTVTTLLSPKLESLDMADSGHAFSLSASLLTERNGRFISDGGSLGLARRMGDGEGPSVHPSGGNGKTSSSEKEV